MDLPDDINDVRDDPFPDGDPPERAPFFMPAWELSGTLSAFLLARTLRQYGVDAVVQIRMSPPRQENK